MASTQLAPDPRDRTSPWADSKPPVLFTHGLRLHASSWRPWRELFTERGYRATAPGWPGDSDTVEQTRVDSQSVANLGINEVFGHYVAIIDGMKTKPIVIGHAFRGMLAEKTARRGLLHGRDRDLRRSDQGRSAGTACHAHQAFERGFGAYTLCGVFLHTPSMT
jgi:pimeloyl-ACP methyl ester carboxylesterase